ncbi:MAG TPA: hypothetical protein VHU61_08905 [Solirubrobacteraceae bacterium]|nr:hypothetical protein [Solirubrobacteraceae bacterium]
MEEFERAPGCLCNVLAVLGDGEEAMQATCRAAIELAESSNARLTLVRTCEPGRSYVWIAPFAVGAAYLPPEVESPDEAARQLACFAEQVPSSIPVTTMVLTSDSQACLLKLLHERHFGAIVAEAALLSRWRRLRRQLRDAQLQMVLIRGECADQDGGSNPRQFSSTGLTKDGAVDAEQVPKGRGRGHAGLRPWSARRLAGAGSKH